MYKTLLILVASIILLSVGYFIGHRRIIKIDDKSDKLNMAIDSMDKVIEFMTREIDYLYSNISKSRDTIKVKEYVYIRKQSEEKYKSLDVDDRVIEFRKWILDSTNRLE